MKKDAKVRVVSGILVIIPCAIFLPLFIIPMFYGIINAGNIVGTLFLTAVFVIWAFFPVIRQVRRLYVLFIIFLLFSAVGFIYAAFLSVNMVIAMSDNPEIFPDKERTVIVLGCMVKGDAPSVMLARRLTAARDYLLEDPNAVCVVTGGLGHNQTHTEADVMRDWLIRYGIAEERIFKEDRSTSTAENLRFAYEIVTQNNLPTNVVIISDGFHLWRAKMLASNHFNEINTIAAQTQRYIMPTYWVREWFAVTREFLFPS